MLAQLQWQAFHVRLFYRVIMNIYMHKERKAVAHVQATSNIPVDADEFILRMELNGWTKCTRAEYREVKKHLDEQEAEVAHG